jgi:hypothetical protein
LMNRASTSLLNRASGAGTLRSILVRRGIPFPRSSSTAQAVYMLIHTPQTGGTPEHTKKR